MTWIWRNACLAIAIVRHSFRVSYNELMPTWLDDLNREVVACERCPRLVVYRQQIAREKRRAYREWEYWGRPVPGFGDSEARVLVLGLAPGAHGSNRTGRPFTGGRFRQVHVSGAL